MPRKRNNKYERVRQNRNYVKKIQQSIDNLKFQLRQLRNQDEKKISELNIKISELESELTHSKVNEKDLMEKLDHLTKEYDKLEFNSERYNNKLLLELVTLKEEYSLLNWVRIILLIY
jgi:predicted  nucleic acid-binding Zn-ribbon protein